MTKKVRNKPRPDSKAVRDYAFRNGQIWQWDDSTVQIKLVGKTLVHYRLYRPGIKRPPVQLSSKTVLEQLLQENGASLVPGPNPSRPASEIAVRSLTASEPLRKSPNPQLPPEPEPKPPTKGQSQWQ